MKRWLGAAGVVVALCACGSSAALSTGAGPARASARCGGPGAQTLAASSVARVFAINGTVYGCLDATGKRFLLGKRSVCIGSRRVESVMVTGELAAYGLEACGVDTGFTQVVVRRLSDGKQLLADPAITGPLGPESYEAIGSLVLKSDGAVAWIALGHSIVSQGAQRREVHSATAAAQKLLDAGRTINPGSLRLHGSTLTWSDGAKTRSATLN